GGHDHGPRARLGRARAEGDSLSDHADSSGRVHHRRRRLGGCAELGGTLPAADSTYLLKIPRRGIWYVRVRL
ncbi:hypothetical protein A2U01_0100631, partial [Trifolium medium]|nr:hypothetical protein [Trifolium medium]